jgi:hypothetical protein
MTKTARPIIGLALGVACLAGPASAQTVLLNFDSPTFNTGNVVGQGGFTGTANSWTVTTGLSSPAGGQALSASSTQTGTVQFTPDFGPETPNFTYNTVGADTVRISFDYAITNKGANNTTYSTVRFGTTTDSNSNALFSLEFRNDGRVLWIVSQNSPGGTQQSPTIVSNNAVTNNTFINLSFELNFATGSIVASINGTEFIPSAAQAPNGILYFRNTAPTSLVTRFQVNTLAQANGLTFDNFSYSVIPEPASAAGLAGFGALGLVACRRRGR